MLAKSIAISALAAIASGHMALFDPKPFPGLPKNNSPLDENGKNFPCKNQNLPTDYDAGGVSNVYAQGSKQNLGIKGTAVHGGGSCQVSVTTDLRPTKNSVWKVIKSFEGGCPAKDQAANIKPVDPEYHIPDKHEYTIPKELAAGNYTLAWTWFNRIGNREMYMNCAPLTVTGSAGSPDFLSGLPDMFVANINTCKLQEGVDLQFPNPGSELETYPLTVATKGKTTPPEKPKCPDVPGGGAPKAAPSGGGAPAPSSTTKMPDQPTSSASSDGGASGSSSSTGLPGGVFVTSTGSQPQPTPTPPAGSPSAPGSQAPAPAPSGGSSPGGGGCSHPPNSACSVEGLWNCIGGTSFQRCASGMWSAIQPMPAGVCCHPGESSDFSMTAATPTKRAVHRPARVRA